MRTRRRGGTKAKTLFKNFARAIGSLKVYRKRAFRNDECAICMERISNPAYTLPCTHRFHRACLDEWRQRSRICPTCRRALPPNLGARAEEPRYPVPAEPAPVTDADGAWNHLPRGFSATQIFALPGTVEVDSGARDPRGPRGWRNTRIVITGPTANDRHAPYGTHPIRPNTDYFYRREGVSNRYQVFERRHTPEVAAYDGSWNHLPQGFVATQINAPRGRVEEDVGDQDPQGPPGWRNTGIRITGPTANDRHAPYGPHPIHPNTHYFYRREGVTNQYQVFERNV